ncbi:MAG: helix-turn-helix transcriptional regulator [Gammaproteobacteria bacterium]|nr:helix-turn-helix transcriptional regulator [Gammaproteobacteria bacterium]
MDYFERPRIVSALQAFDSMPHAVWWKDDDLVFRLMNHQTANTLGYKGSQASFEGITDDKLPCRASELAHEFEVQDTYVIRTGKQLSDVCFCEYANNSWKVLLGNKHPLFDENNKIVGMSGISIDITSCKVMRSALLLLSDDDKLIGRKLNSLNQFTYMLKETYDDFGLNLRESEILFLLIRGKSAKEIGRKVDLSFRTVEKYLEQIKVKLNCSSKSELVEKAISLGAGSIIPKSIIGES